MLGWLLNLGFAGGTAISGEVVTFTQYVDQLKTFTLYIDQVQPITLYIDQVRTWSIER